MTDAMLVLNAGSSSLKFAVYARRRELSLLVRGSVSPLHDKPRLEVVNAAGQAIRQKDLNGGSVSSRMALQSVVNEVRDLRLFDRIFSVGHRIVHGGRRFTAPTILDKPALEALRELVPLAPIHQPHNLEIIEWAADLLPGTSQIGCFDTAFHVNRPRLAKLYGLPRKLSESGVISFGFHGISYGYIASKLRQRYGPKAGGRTIVAHLGSGASLCAMRQGKSIATTMGFSPLDGLVMSTRCGSLDPGVVIYLLQHQKMSIRELSELLYDQSGLLGVSGTTGDMSALLKTDNPSASEAIDLFVYRAGREIGSLAAALGGLDTLVFTAGIGENSPVIRERICDAASWLGVKIDLERNRRAEADIKDAGSAVDVLVIPTDEERAIGEQMLPLVPGRPKQPEAT